jgi:flagellar protein FlaI
MIEFILSDHQLEEVVVNEATEPIWVYHRKHGWLKTNIFLRDEEQTRHYASIIGRKVGRQISVLEPLLDAHLDEGDRVNATLMPISTGGNTLTFRKFSRDPWTVTKFIQTRTISVEAAAIVWLAMQYEMSALIAGGTASGKTSALNCFADLFPPNQRIISIEDTREIRLPKHLHWVPLNTRLPNAEGKGQISMEDLLVNSLRMRPDRILVGEVRRQKEAETLFEAIHTGHSVYATFHANNAEQTVERLTNPPINVPKILLPAISLIIVQFRNRRSGMRRTFQVAEILDDATVNIIMQYDQNTDKLVKKNPSKSLFKSLKLYTGMSDSEINKDIVEKEKILEYMLKNNIAGVDEVGRIIAEYYTNKPNLMKFVNTNKKFEE